MAKLPRPRPFAPPLEAQFQASRREALAEINVTTFWLVAFLVLLFSAWDWFVDPVGWWSAFLIRAGGALVILATGLAQRVSGRVEWAPRLSKIRFAAAVIAVAGALAVLERGFLVGIAGLVSVLLAGPYIAIDRRDLLALNAAPLAATGAIMWAAELDRFVVVNAAVFIALAVAVSLLLARVFEASNRRAFALEQELTREARTDSLTGLRNRRALEEVAGVEAKRAARTASPLAVIVCDVDHFKQINDRHGHDTGDRVIRAVGELLRAVARESDAIGRWGGEEFLAILPETDIDAAAVLAHRMRKVVADAPMPMPDGAHVTASFGVAAIVPTSEPAPGAWSRVLRLADDAMYRAKAAGRNRVALAEGSPDAHDAG